MELVSKSIQVSFSLNGNQELKELDVEYVIKSNQDVCEISYQIHRDQSFREVLNIHLSIGGVSVFGSPFVVLPSATSQIDSGGAIKASEMFMITDFLIKDGRAIVLRGNPVLETDDSFHVSVYDLNSKELVLRCGKGGDLVESVSVFPRFVTCMDGEVVVVSDQPVVDECNELVYLLKCYRIDTGEFVRTVRYSRQVAQSWLLECACYDNKLYLFFWSKTDGTTCDVLSLEGNLIQCIPFPGLKDSKGVFYLRNGTQVLADIQQVIFTSRHQDQDWLEMFDLSGNPIRTIDPSIYGWKRIEFSQSTSRYLIVFEREQQQFTAVSFETGELITRWTMRGASGDLNCRFRLNEMTESEGHIYGIGIWEEEDTDELMSLDSIAAVDHFIFQIV